MPDGSQKVEAIEQKELLVLEAKVIPPDGIELPVNWGDLGLQLIDSGVIDKEKFMAIYTNREDVSESDKKLLEESSNGKIIMTQRNANFLLNLFWALGLGNKNEILEKGPMTDQQYGGADKFASTGGWTLARGDAMDHYSKHSFVILTSSQQTLVERVSQNIYRPCCGNSAYFPDCNHGMAMLGLLELMASQGVSEREMYKVALQVNAYWFLDTYLTIAKYLETKGDSWQKADPKEILGPNYSSAAGYQKILSQVSPPTQRGGGSCGV
ncbi:MAG: hypothetical protein A3B86_01315 [Candidatus Yanofskybacteria bacterium RIFCSPHIGHO2_02_FULL_38_22b]|uniref:Uncharacterized protein n=1 Tax=Candidatus Yanofskybacteria bacterium RIFCSPHIGHO2_02_FULL_38_22b TaxID=1802673 RepID=A0A1F8F2M3_9BACT|nr:MAG: hypothetical protein A3B86_01315 [Candidatus Yanofskybacteria bacterium RIFCSPHIGHO2_02_FULL_38_22b]OGN20426.1 MAG: hypothetical protein A2910_01660 [Candidatus Yanofskybacteria bacterium RIFCSPLOWO2_01_FULL_39_28]